MNSLSDAKDRAVHTRSVRHLARAVILIALLNGCSAAPSSATSTTGPAGASLTAGEASAQPSAAATTTVEAAGLKLVATFDRLEVPAGGRVTISLTIENSRPTDVVFIEPCGPDAMTVAVRVPTEPIGLDHEGIAAAFKTYALEQSTGSPIESSIRGRLSSPAETQPCHASIGSGRDPAGNPRRIIEAGMTYETTLTWTAEIVKGIPAASEEAPFSIKVLYDLAAAGGGLTHAETLEATGVISVVDGAPSAITAGQALDAVIVDRKFAKWLAKQRPASWVNANLFLQPAARAAPPLPEVPYWDVELFREPRNWAIAYVDARTANLLKLSICEIPCDR
jgi:hypothetical protein